MIHKSALTFAVSAIMALGIIPYSANSQNITPQKAYEDAIAFCNSGQPGINVANCLRDAGAALQQAKRGGNKNVNSNFESNQRARCERLMGTQRENCLELMSQSDVTTRGSVEGGGIIRERTVVIPAD